MEEKQMVSYPSIEKPWLKYYSDEAKNAQLPKCTIYEYLLNNNREHYKDTALIYFGRRITYGGLIEKIELVAASFVALGVQKGDIVTIQALSIPQVVYMIYALSKIGAIANLVYVTSTADEVMRNLFETKSKVYVTIDSVYNSFKHEFKKEYVQNIVLLSLKDEMNTVAKVMLKLKVKDSYTQRVNNTLDWKAFVSLGANSKTDIAGRNTDPVIMVYTGGTTGKSKGVMLSNYNLNVGALQYLYLGFERKKRFLCVLPPFIAFGLTVTIHMPLSFGLQTALCIAADPTEIGSFVEQYKPNYIICGTAQAEKMMIALDTKRTDLSNLELLGVGGDALPIALERRMNEFLTSRKSKTRIIQGYAMSETSASSTAAVHTIHKQGTVGIPFVYTTIKVVGVDTMDELSYGQNGEICINTPCAMMGYYQNEKETNSILKRHSDGSLWVHTGDIGNIDQDGFVTIVGRIKRMILTQEGNVFHKVFPKILEDKFLEVKGVEAISIVAKQSKETTNDLVAFVVLDMITPEEEALVALDQFATENLERYERPKKYIFLNRLPLTTVGKVNYRMLEQEAEKTKC